MVNNEDEHIPRGFYGSVKWKPNYLGSRKLNIRTQHVSSQHPAPYMGRFASTAHMESFHLLTSRNGKNGLILIMGCHCHATYTNTHAKLSQCQDHKRNQAVQSSISGFRPDCSAVMTR